MNEASQRLDKQQIKLVKFLGTGCKIIAVDEHSYVLKTSKTSKTFAISIVDHLISKGVLAKLRQSELVLTQDGKSWLRRSLSADDGFRAQHGELGKVEVAKSGDERHVVTKDLSESPLTWLARRKDRKGIPLISQKQFVAGERFRSDFDRGQLLTSLSTNWSSRETTFSKHGSGDGLANLTDSRIAAQQRIQKALNAIGPEFSGLLIDICCFLKRLEQVEFERNWPSRSAKVVLKLALDALSRHYESA